MSKKLTKSKDDKVISGVIGGFASYFNVSSKLLRFIFFVLIFASNTAVIWLYILFAILLPKGSNKKQYQNKSFKKLEKSKDNIVITGLIGGFAEYTGIDATVLRISFVFVTLFTLFLPIIPYFIFALIVPTESQGTFVDTIESTKFENEPSDWDDF